MGGNQNSPRHTWYDNDIRTKDNTPSPTVLKDDGMLENVLARQFFVISGKPENKPRMNGTN